MNDLIAVALTGLISGLGVGWALANYWPRCEHKWENVKEGEILTAGKVIGHMWIDECSLCGKVRMRKVEL